MKKLIVVLFILALMISVCNATTITNVMRPGDDRDRIPINFQNEIPSPVMVTSTVNASFGVDVAGYSFVAYNGNTYLQNGWVWAPNEVTISQAVPLAVLNYGIYWNAIWDGASPSGWIIYKLGW